MGRIEWLDYDTTSGATGVSGLFARGGDSAAVPAVPAALPV